MSTECYAMVRGSAIRVTALDSCGDLPDTISAVASKAVSSIRINEVTDAGNDELLRNDTEEGRIRFTRPTQTIRFTVDIEFVKVSPALLAMLIGSDAVINYSGDIVGFDAKTRYDARSVALEVWTRLAEMTCDGERQYGYTLFPYLRGGYVTGVTFSNGAVSFTVRGAQTRRGAKWGVGPYDISGPFQRLPEPVSGNANWRQVITTLAPPLDDLDQIVEFIDQVDGGNAFSTSPDILDGEFVTTSAWIVDGGWA